MQFFVWRRHILLVNIEYGTFKQQSLVKIFYYHRDQHYCFLILYYFVNKPQKPDKQASVIQKKIKVAYIKIVNFIKCYDK